MERADAGVSNPRDLWDASAVALRFAGAIELIPRLLEGVWGKPTPRYKGIRLRADALAAPALQEVQEGLSNNNTLAIL